MQYKILVSKLKYGHVIVEASSEQDAKNKVMEKCDGNVAWIDEEITDILVTERGENLYERM